MDDGMDDDRRRLPTRGPGGVGLARRAAATVAGVVLCAAGALLLVLPGPGLLLLLAGLVVLAEEYPWARRRVAPVRRAAVKAARESVASPLRIAASALAGLALLAAGVAWIVAPELPAGGVATGSSLILSGLALIALLVHSVRRFRHSPVPGSDPAPRSATARR